MPLLGLAADAVVVWTTETPKFKTLMGRMGVRMLLPIKTQVSSHLFALSYESEHSYRRASTKPATRYTSVNLEVGVSRGHFL